MVNSFSKMFQQSNGPEHVRNNPTKGLAFFGGRCEREGSVEEYSDRWMTLPLPNNSSVASIHGVPRERVRPG